MMLKRAVVPFSFASALLVFINCSDVPAHCSTDVGVYSEEGANMAPGGDCIGCHAAGEGPVYQIAGTVMKAPNDDTNCAGIGGAVVRITDATGAVVDIPTTTDGNFFYGGDAFRADIPSPIVMPYTAKVLLAGRERSMVQSQTSGDCAGCHTATGQNGAPGRILAP